MAPRRSVHACSLFNELQGNNDRCKLAIVMKEVGSGMKEVRSYCSLVFLLGCTATVFTSECQWTAWSLCSMSCGTGYQTSRRSRQCLPSDGQNCTDRTYVKQKTCMGPDCVSSQGCSSQTCQNGGECHIVGAHSYCRCESNYTGPACEVTVTEATTMCPPLTNPARGWVSVSNDITIARYGCELNHALTKGESTRRCNRETGAWAGQSPRCEKSGSNDCPRQQCGLRCVFGYLHDLITGCDVCSCYPGCPAHEYGNIIRCHNCSCRSDHHCDERDGYCSQHPPPDHINLVQGDLPTDWTTDDYSGTYYFTSTPTSDPDTGQPDTEDPNTGQSVGSEKLPVMIIGTASAGGFGVLLLAFLVAFLTYHKCKRSNQMDMRTTSSRKRQSWTPAETVAVGYKGDEIKPLPPPRPPEHHHYMTMIKASGDSNLSRETSHKYLPLMTSTPFPASPTNPENGQTEIYQEIDDVMEQKSCLESQSHLEMSEVTQDYIELEKPTQENDYIQPIESRL